MTFENRVNEDDLDFDDDVRTFDGVPYTGLTYLAYPNGALMRESTFREGFREGQCREWHLNGRVKREWTAKRGRAEGVVTEWHDTGTIKSVSLLRYGVETEYAEWSPSGEEIVSRRLDDDSPLADYVRKMRRQSDQS